MWNQTEVEEVREQVTVTEEVTKEGKPKKVTKKKIIRRKGREQQVSESYHCWRTRQSFQLQPVTDGPTEEIVGRGPLKALPAPEHAKPGEVEEVREQVTHYARSDKRRQTQESHQKEGYQTQKEKNNK